MKKTFALPLAAALVLAACSNPADGFNPALLAGTSAPAAAEAPAQQTAGTPAESGQETEVQPEAQAPAKKGVAVDWDMNLDGYEEIPKDDVYGINWVYLPKERVDANVSILIKESGNIKLKPVEFHANTADFKFCYYLGGQCRECTGAYKCVVYFKNNEDVVYDGMSCSYNHVSENFEADAISLKFIRSSQVMVSKSTTVSGAEEFKQHYGQY